MLLNFSDISFEGSLEVHTNNQVYLGRVQWVRSSFGGDAVRMWFIGVQLPVQYVNFILLSTSCKRIPALHYT